ncbi:MAG: serine hydrolase [Ferruginibacter sp.]
MRLLKIILKVVAVLFIIALIITSWIAWKVFPAVSGYGAKNMCSAVFIQHRKPADIINEDLDFFPMTLGSFTLNEKDSSVTGTVWGFAKRKAIYRERIGCTLINDLTEDEIRKQQFAIPSQPVVSKDTIAWPYGDKIMDTVPPNIDRVVLNTAIDSAMTAYRDGKPGYTRAMLVLYDGKIIAEKYAPGFDINTRLLGWSMSKSLTAAMIGVLVKQGKLTVDAPAPVAEWKGTDKEKITLKNLLQQSTGLDFTEIYDRPSDVTKMLFSTGDMAAYTASRPLAAEPGTVFNYSSGNSNILSRIIRKTAGENDYAGFPFKELFYKINAYSFILEPDASGTYIGSSYSYGTARDFARFGLLYYNNGVWNGEQLLPENWVKDTREPCAANKFRRYGYQFWLNGLNEKEPTSLRFPDAPADMYFCNGFGGQSVFIIPSKKLIVVRLGIREIDRNKFLKEIIAAVK